MGNTTYSLEEVQKIANQFDFTVLSKEYVNFKTPLTFKHNHETCQTFERSLKDFLRGNKSCPSCSTFTGHKLSFIEMKKIISDETQREYKLISYDKTKNARKPSLEILHKTCGETYPVSWSNWKLGKRCPICAAKSNESKAAQLLKNLLKANNISYVEEKVFDECKNSFSGAQLRYDIFIPSKNLLIEIDGEQHFIPVARFGGEKKLQERKFLDFLKNKFALSSGKELLRLSLFDTEKHKRKTELRIKREVFETLAIIVDRVDV